MNLNDISVSMLENRLKSMNPQLYGRYISMKNSGKSPDQVINEMLNSGMITKDDIGRASGMVGYSGPRF